MLPERCEPTRRWKGSVCESSIQVSASPGIGTMTFDEFMQRQEERLLHIKKRYYFLKAVEVEVQEVGGKRFRIMNDIVWNLLLDSFDMLIIDFASFLRAMWPPGGLFNSL